MAQRHNQEGMITELPIDADRNLWLRQYQGGAIREANWQEYATDYSAEHFIDLAEPSLRDQIMLLDGDNRERHPKVLRRGLLTRYVGHLSAVNIVMVNNPRNQHRLLWMLKDFTDTGIALANISLSAPGPGTLASLAERMDAPGKVVEAIAEYGS